MAVDVLQAKIRKLKNPTMVCICPTIRELPLHIKEDARHQYGQTLRAAAEAYKTFSFGILDALKDTVPAVSVISGAFSALGADGVAAMQEVLSYAASLGYYVLLDLMRADLGTTAEDLANACFGKIQVGEESFTPYPCDGVLMSGFLGSDAVKPFAEFCREGKNVFIVARSSNKSAREVQDLLSGDRVVYQVMADLAMRWSTGLFGTNGYSEIGIAVGATNRPVLETLCANTTGCSSLFPATARRVRAQRTRSLRLTVWDTVRPSWRAEAFSMPSGSRTETDRTISRRRFRQRKK